MDAVGGRAREEMENRTHPTDDRNPFQTFLQNDAHVSMGVHKVRQTPRVPPVCIDLEVVRVMSLVLLRVSFEAGTNLVIRDEDRFLG